MKIVWQIFCLVALSLILVFFFMPGPTVGFHLTTKPEGGYTEYCVIEERRWGLNIDSFCSEDPSTTIQVYQHLVNQQPPQRPKALDNDPGNVI